MSLIVTAHRMRHLDEALHSVNEQTTSEAELILVADLSGEHGVQATMERFARHWRRAGARAHVISARGGSAGRVRNAGAQCATSPWITYLDGDDVLAPAALATMTEKCATDEADILSSGLWHIIDGRTIDVPESCKYRPHQGLYLHDPEMTQEAVYLHQLLAIRRSLWLGYRWSENGGEDLDFILHQLLAGRFRKIAQPLYGHRRVPDGYSERGRRQSGQVCDCGTAQRYRSGYYRNLLETRLTTFGRENLEM